MIMRPYLIHLMDETKWQFDHTYMTEETEEIRKQQAIEAQKCKKNHYQNETNTIISNFTSAIST